MSQDLFAAFGSGNDEYQKPPSELGPAPSSSFFDDLTIQPSTNQWTAPSIPASEPSVFYDNPEIHQNEDDWGDFEGASQQTPVQSTAPIASQFSRWLDDEPAKSDNPAQSIQPTFPSSKFGVSTQELQQKFTQPKPKPTPVPRDPHVLFDAEHDEPEEDDFGDFEEPIEEANHPEEAPDLLGLDFSASAPPTTKAVLRGSTVQPSPSLLDLDSLVFNSTEPPATSAKPAKASYDLSSLGPVTSQLKSVPKKTTVPSNSIDKTPTSPRRPVIKKPSTPTPPLPSIQADESWDDFAAWEQDRQPALQTSTVIASKPAIPSPLLSPASNPASNELPPTNIPPPASLLSLFPPLFTSAENDFFRPTSSESQAVRSRIYTDPATITYLKGLLALATVCARVIAGRKNRWKRDAILAQSMRIGPAAAGGHSGLKLTSVDKGEATKEDREVADVLRSWQTVIGRLKAALSEVKKLSNADLESVPNLRDVMPIRVAKEVEGGVSGFKPCALCGLKREERVEKVDFEVMDSFGEWWVEGMNMHRACRNFWEGQREVLRQR